MGVRFSPEAPNHALLVKWYNNCFVISNWQFDSVKGHQSYGVVDVVVAYLTVNQSERVRFPTTPHAALADVVIAMEQQTK